MKLERARTDALAILAAALRSVDPVARVEAALRAGPPVGPVVVVGAGKAAAGMAAGAVRALGPQVVGGCVVLPDGVTAELPPSIRVVRGDHPVPGARSLDAGRALLDAVRELPAGHAIVGLWSGGASAMVEVLRGGVTLESLQQETAAWLREGVPIDVINARRRERSALKGGGLARATRGRFHNLVLSDVPGDDPALVGSGPAVTPGDGSRVIASPAHALRGARGEAFGLRYATVVLDPALSGPARTVGERVAAAIRAVPAGAPPLCLLCAGEPVVHVTGDGRGGRMQEAALAAAVGIDGLPAVVLCAATDGKDGPTDASGALVDGTSAARLRLARIGAAEHLQRNDSHPALDAVGDLLRSGPTGTNVADLVIALVPG